VVVTITINSAVEMVVSYSPTMVSVAQKTIGASEMTVSMKQMIALTSNMIAGETKTVAGRPETIVSVTDMIVKIGYRAKHNPLRELGMLSHDRFRDGYDRVHHGDGRFPRWT
jgi:hypothetical protein